jgi:hypothetical protein
MSENEAPGEEDRAARQVVAAGLAVAWLAGHPEFTLDGFSRVWHQERARFGDLDAGDGHRALMRAVLERFGRFGLSYDVVDDRGIYCGLLGMHLEEERGRRD